MSIDIPFNMTVLKALKRKMMVNSKIFALLSENEDKFGKVSIDDIKDQMNMYKTEEGN